jgi:hypothetical protein
MKKTAKKAGTILAVIGLIIGAIILSSGVALVVGIILGIMWLLNVVNQ